MRKLYRSNGIASRLCEIERAIGALQNRFRIKRVSREHAAAAADGDAQRGFADNR